MSISSLLSRGIASLQSLGITDRMIQQLGREGFFIGSLDQLGDLVHQDLISGEDRRMIHGIVSTLLQGGSAVLVNTAPSTHYVTTSRPVLLQDQTFATAHFRLFDSESPRSGGMMVVRGEAPRFVPPPSIPLDTQEPLKVLQLLEYADIHYTDPRSPAAVQGFSTFLSGRNYVLDRLEKLEGTGQSLDWIGFDWDFTTDVYRIYAEILPLASLKLFHEPPKDSDKKFIRVLEAAKPGMHELMVGMMAGYAIHQGLFLFNQWEQYLPQVRVVTQTWPERMMVLGNQHMRLIPLLMGRLPGLEFNVDAVKGSPAFITLHDFLREADFLLESFREAGFRFECLEPTERDDLMAILRIGKGHVVKSLGAFEAKGWTRPSLIFDDGAVSNAHLRRAGVETVDIQNPLAPGREMSDWDAVTLLGRKAAVRQILQMLTPPDGTVVMLHDTQRSLDLFFSEFELPKRRMKRKIRDILRDAGGLRAVERNYHK